MKITLKAVIWGNKADRHGLCPIAIEIVGGGKRTYYNTGIKVNTDHFIKGQIVKGAENWDILNARLQDKITTAKRDILNMELQGQKVDIDTAKKLFRPEAIKGMNFYKFAEDLINTKKEPTRKRYTVELDKLKEYDGSKLSFGEITPKWLTAYQTYLLSATAEKKANSSNTAINAFKVIRHAFNEAIDAKLIKYYPFDDWDYPPYKQPKKGYLTLDECSKLFGLLDKKEVADSIKKVISFFLLECFSGIRISDWGKFSVEKIVRNNEMIFTTTKTGTDVRLPLDLMPSLNRVVNYISAGKIKWDNTGKHANDMLAVIAPLANIDKHLTTHVARHTCATQLLSIGMSPESIAIILGITVRQVSTYAKVSPDKIRNEFKRLGGGI